jgi:ribosomal-protein-alanine N-acetyltransferase
LPDGFSLNRWKYSVLADRYPRKSLPIVISFTISILDKKNLSLSFLTMVAEKTVVLESSRLILHPLTLSQLQLYKESDNQLEIELGLPAAEKKLSSDFYEVIVNSNIPFLTRFPELMLWGTLWMIIEKGLNRIIGDIGFKGAPTESGLIEVGYTLYAEYRQKGYMSEALQLLCDWALSDEQVRIIVAETNKLNIASQRTLNKVHFKAFAETDTDYWWRLDKDLDEE